MSQAHYHFIGIGGIGMSALARILIAKKQSVSGSDLARSYVTEALQNLGATVFLGHASQNVPSGSTVVYTSYYKKESHPEYQEAIRLNCPVLHRSDLLALLMHDTKTLAVAGTHGKTTTSALLTTVLVEAGWDPTFAVGGVLQQFQSNGEYGQGHYFVAEADESDGTFLKYHPFGAIITNIDLDHMDYFGSEDSLCKAFKKFTTQVVSERHLFWCGDDHRLQGLGLPGISYGVSENCLLRASKIRQEGWNLLFDVHFEGKIYSDVCVSLIGLHNVKNALAVFGMALALNIPDELSRKGLKGFQGVKRRCEKKGDESGVLVLDDYAHHPTEIETTIRGIRQAIGKRRLVVIFQPHRYSRTVECMGLFQTVFFDADLLIITDIYGAGETPIEGVSAQNILREVRSENTVSCLYIAKNELLKGVLPLLKHDDVVVTLGAGDITEFGASIVRELREKGNDD